MGARTLKAGTSKLAAGTVSASAGASKLAVGSATLAVGTGQLASGAHSASGGTRTLATGRSTGRFTWAQWGMGVSEEAHPASVPSARLGATQPLP